MKRSQNYPDDDGRTIADMSWVESPNPIGFGKKRQSQSTQQDQTRPWEDHSLSRSARWAAVFGAWKAAILIALAYIVGLGLVIWAMTAFMK